MRFIGPLPTWNCSRPKADLRAAMVAWLRGGRTPSTKDVFVKTDRAELIRLVTEFVCEGTGGPQKYAGKDMVAAHRGMNISEQEYLAVTDDIMAALDKNGVGDQEKREMLMIAFSLKGEILRQ